MLRIKRFFIYICESRFTPSIMSKKIVLLFIFYSIVFKAQTDTIFKTIEIPEVNITNLKNTQTLSNNLKSNTSNIIPSKIRNNGIYLTSLQLSKNKDLEIVALELNFDLKNENNVEYKFVPIIYQSATNTENLIKSVKNILYKTNKINSILIYFDEKIRIKHGDEILVGCQFINENTENYPFVVRAYPAKNRANIYYCNKDNVCNQINGKNEKYSFNYKVYYK